MAGKLYLVPTTIGSTSWNEVIPSGVVELTRGLKFFVVEELRTARRYLSALGIQTPIENLCFFTLNEHSSTADLTDMLKPLLDGNDVGLMSESGLPAIADPGSMLVSAAHHHGIRVVPLCGPSSIIMTMMASGLNGQNFAFVGYLPVKSEERKRRIRQLEQRSRAENQTQLFIEAPYRNVALFRDILQTCADEARLTIAAGLTLEGEYIATKKIREWKQLPIPDINKINTVFALLF